MQVEGTSVDTQNVLYCALLGVTCSLTARSPTPKAAPDAPSRPKRSCPPPTGQQPVTRVPDIDSSRSRSMTRSPAGIGPIRTNSRSPTTCESGPWTGRTSSAMTRNPSTSIESRSTGSTPASSSFTSLTSGTAGCTYAPSATDGSTRSRPSGSCQSTRCRTGAGVDLPDQYGRNWDGGDRESPAPIDPHGSDLPMIGPWDPRR
jgi:hypothetical protein